MEDPDDFQSHLEAARVGMRKELERQRLELPLPPTPEASVLMLKASLGEELQNLAQQSAALDRPAKVTAFAERLDGLQWKRYYCHKTPEQVRARAEREMIELERQYKGQGGFRIPSRGDKPGLFRRSGQVKDEEAKTETPNPRSKEELSWEREAAEEERRAHSLPWTDFTLPLAVSAHDVAAIAQAEGHESNLVREADALSQKLLDRSMLAPSDETMELADCVLLLAKQLMRAKPSQGSKRRSSSPSAKAQTRPQPTVIDETATTYLMAALASGHETGEHYVPKRQDIVKAVSKQLNYEIKIASLFGTKDQQGNRVPRYPRFLELWQKTQSQVRAAHPRKRASSRRK